jgi:hypothetical protein
MPTIQTANALESEVIKMTVNEIVSTYPKTINSEQLRIILGISKRKCAWMLQNGVIPCKDTEKKTRRYAIEITDVIHYVNTVSENPNLYFIPPIFSAKKSTSEIRYPNELREDFSVWLTKRWCHRKETLIPKDIEKLIGYEHESVRRWLNRGHLKCVKAHGDEIIAKEWLIAFLSDYRFKIAKKSQKELLNEYFS